MNVKEYEEKSTKKTGSLILLRNRTVKKKQKNWHSRSCKKTTIFRTFRRQSSTCRRSWKKRKRKEKKEKTKKY